MSDDEFCTCNLQCMWASPSSLEDIGGATKISKLALIRHSSFVAVPGGSWEGQGQGKKARGGVEGQGVLPELS